MSGQITSPLLFPPVTLLAGSAREHRESDKSKTMKSASSSAFRNNKFAPYRAPLAPLLTSSSSSLFARPRPRAQRELLWMRACTRPRVDFFAWFLRLFFLANFWDCERDSVLDLRQGGQHIRVILGPGCDRLADNLAVRLVLVESGPMLPIRLIKRVLPVIPGIHEAHVVGRRYALNVVFIMLPPDRDWSGKGPGGPWGGVWGWYPLNMSWIQGEFAREKAHCAERQVFKLWRSRGYLLRHLLRCFRLNGGFLEILTRGSLWERTVTIHVQCAGGAGGPREIFNDAAGAGGIDGGIDNYIN
ncbi:hypothetical protein K438DRAFT_1756788 [Mycena galopus ATCC 62051]|nr:hypothetical protein K438DRAFT_1756788 [Mycena galopus ATCC 62051]